MIIFAIGLMMAASAASAQSVATTTTLAVTSDGNAVTAVAPGTVITLTATVTAGGTAVTPGQVKFCDAAAKACADIHLLGTAQLISSGTAVLKFVPGAGIDSYKAVFLGTTGYAASSSDVSSLTVTGQLPTTTTVAQSGSPGNYTLTATVTGNSNFAPGGAVSFLDTSNSNYVLGSANLLLGNGASALSFFNSWNASGPAPNFPPGDYGGDEAYAVTGDFNGDGKPDLAVSWQNTDLVTNSGDSAELVTYLGNGDGTFTAVPSPLNVDLNFSVVGDFNGDGKQDIAGMPYGIRPAVQVLLGNGDGTFQQLTPEDLLLPGIPANQGFSSAISPPAEGDFNGDGKLDLITTISVSNATEQVGTYISTLLGNGDGTFQQLTPQQIDLTSNNGFVVGDFNGDGILDVATGDSVTGAIEVYLGKGDGTFQSSPMLSPIGGAPDPYLVGDFNGDGILDIVTISGDVLLGKGDGTFTLKANSGTNSELGYAAVGDFNGDGIADLAAGDSGKNASGLEYGWAVVQLGNGDGTFSPPLSGPPLNPNSYLSSLIAGDFNDDGLSDLALGTGSLSPSGGPAPPGEIIQLAQMIGGSTATATLTGISPVGTGIHLVDASYPGDINYSGSVSATTPLVAERVVTTLSLTANLSGNGEQFLLTATLTLNEAQNHNASGMVTFYNNNVSLGQGTVANGVATLTATLPFGSDSITAVYPGDTNFDPSTSAALPLNLDFSISASTNSQSIYTGFAASYTVTVTPDAGFDFPVALSCTQLPANTTCSFSPATLTGGSGSSTLVVQTSAPRPASSASVLFTKARIPLLAGLFLLILPSRLRRYRNGWPMFLLILTLLAVGCSSPGQLTGSTPVGKQTITVTGIATNGPQTLTHTVNVTLNVNSLF